MLLCLVSFLHFPPIDRSCACGSSALISFRKGTGNKGEHPRELVDLRHAYSSLSPPPLNGLFRLGCSSGFAWRTIEYVIGRSWIQVSPLFAPLLPCDSFLCVKFRELGLLPPFLEPFKLISVLALLLWWFEIVTQLTSTPLQGANETNAIYLFWIEPFPPSCFLACC